VVLGGLALPKDKEKEAESSEGKTSNPKKHQEGEREKSPEREENPKTEKEAADPPKEHNLEMEIKDTNPPETQSPETGTKASIPRKSKIHSVHQGRLRNRLGSPSPLSHPCSRRKETYRKGGFLAKS
jgi:hypothetical protein